MLQHTRNSAVAHGTLRQHLPLAYHDNSSDCIRIVSTKKMSSCAGLAVGAWEGVPILCMAVVVWP